MQTHCSNCGTEVIGDYCSNCGQKIGKKDSTLWSIIVDTFMNLIDLDRSVFAAILYVLRRPFKIIESYWMGNRKLYASPGKILLFSLALAAIHLTQVDENILGGAVNAEYNDNQVGDKEIIFWVIMIPFLVLISSLAFIRKRMGIAKHLVSTLYISTTFFILLTVLQDIFLLSFHFDIYMGMGMLVFLLLVFFWNSRVFNKGMGFSHIVGGFFLQILVVVLIFALIISLISVLKPKGLSTNAL